MDDLKNSERDLNIPWLKIKMFFLEIKISSDMWVMTSVEKDSTTLKIVT